MLKARPTWESKLWGGAAFKCLDAGTSTLLQRRWLRRSVTPGKANKDRLVVRPGPTLSAGAEVNARADHAGRAQVMKLPLADAAQQLAQVGRLEQPSRNIALACRVCAIHKRPGSHQKVQRPPICRATRSRNVDERPLRTAWSAISPMALLRNQGNGNVDVLVDDVLLAIVPGLDLQAKSGNTIGLCPRPTAGRGATTW